MQLLSTQSFGRILTALLLAPSAVNLCLAAPQPLGNTVAGSATLEPRTDTTELKNFKKKVDEADVKATQDTTKFVDFSKKGQKSVSSKGFNQCFGIIIATSKGAVAGHYTCGSVGKDRAREQLGNYYNANKADKLKNPRVWIYAKVKVSETTHAIQENEFENGADLAAFKKIIKDDLKIDREPTVVKYHDVDAVIVDKGQERPGFDQKTAHTYSFYAGFYVYNRLVAGPDVKFMTLDMQKASYKEGK